MPNNTVCSKCRYPLFNNDEVVEFDFSLVDENGILCRRCAERQMGRPMMDYIENNLDDMEYEDDEEEIL